MTAMWFAHYKTTWKMCQADLLPSALSAGLTAQHQPAKVVGAWPLDTFFQDLDEKDSFSVTSTYLRALLTEAGKNLKRWLMEKALARLPPSMKDTSNTRVKVLTFVSCINIVMDDDYVDFSQMRDGIADLHRQFLQKWQIQSRFTLPKVYNMALWRLHEDIWISDIGWVQCLIVFSRLSLLKIIN